MSVCPTFSDAEINQWVWCFSLISSFLSSSAAIPPVVLASINYFPPDQLFNEELPNGNFLIL